MSGPVVGPVVGPDGRARCPWAGGGAPGSVGETYARYHDEEWGRAVHGTAPLYERLVLEGFQSGLAWITILRKRPAFRAAFAGFDPGVVAAYGPDDVERLLADAGIVRNRAKVEAAVSNARAVLALDVPLDELLWSYAPVGPLRAPRTTADVPATTAGSTAMAQGLRARGLRFVGPTTCYALMQATGMVDDHLAGCWVRGAPSREVTPV